MKKYLIFLSVCVPLLLGSCEKEIKSRLDEIEDRLDQLEAICLQLNSDVASLRSIVEAVQSQDYITSITPVFKDAVIVGYTIIFHNGDPITIYNGSDGNDGTDGEDGADGQEGKTPVIGVRKDGDGFYYWTIDGEWLLGENGYKIRAVANDGDDGQDGITPQFKIEDGRWMLSTDGGVSWKDVGAATGEEGDSFFEEVTEDENGVYLVLADGTTITLPKEPEFSIVLEENTDIGISAGGSATIGYTLVGATTQSTVKAFGQNGWSAKATRITESSGTITVKAPDPLIEDEIIVLAFDGTDRTIVLGINFVTGEVLVSPTTYSLSNLEGSQEVDLLTNTEYIIDIPEETKPWLSVETTKGFRNDVVTFLFSANEGMIRHAKVAINNDLGDTLRTISFVQVGKALELDVETPGTLSTLITPEEKQFSRAIIITGELDGSDYYFIKQMPALQILDISGISNSTLPSGVFKNWTTIEKIYLPKTLGSIPEEMCYGCTGMVGFTFPDSAITINANAFWGCTALEGDLIIPNSVETIGVGAFERSGFTGSLYMGERVKSIGSYSFRRSRFGGTLELNGNMETIASYAFMDCSSFNGDLIIPQNVRSIESFAFAFCGFNGDLVVGDKLTSIGTYAFNGCQFTGDLTIGKAVERILTGAFDGCGKIKNVYSKALIPPSALSSFPVTNYLGVPTGCSSAYRSSANWDDFLVVEEIAF